MEGSKLRKPISGSKLKIDTAIEPFGQQSIVGAIDQKVMEAVARHHLQHFRSKCLIRLARAIDHRLGGNGARKQQAGTTQRAFTGLKTGTLPELRR